MKQAIFDYLDGFSFVSLNEVHSAICDYIEQRNGILYYSDMVRAGDIALEYKENKHLLFNNNEDE